MKHQFLILRKASLSYFFFHAVLLAVSLRTFHQGPITRGLRASTCERQLLWSCDLRSSAC